MKILVISASLPYPPQQGGALRTFGIIKGLHEAGHEVRLLCFHDPAIAVHMEETPLAEFLASVTTVNPPTRKITHRLSDLVLSSKPDIARRLYSVAFIEQLKQIIAAHSFDLIQFEGIEVACYVEVARTMSPKSKLCYNAFNAEAALQQMIFEVDRADFHQWPAAIYSMIQSRRIERFEREISQAADLVLAVSKEDAEALRQYRTDREISVIANGVFSVDYGNPGEALDLGEAALVFTGKMDYRPNVDAALWFVNDILPQVRGQFPTTKFYIVGQKPHSKLDTLRDKPGVSITGWVNDVQPFLRGTTVYVAPLRMGSGTRLKLLEAMAAGCAVVATTTAASGLTADSRNGLLIADTPDDIAQHIVSLLRDPVRCKTMGAEAQQYVRENYDWSVIMPRLIHAYQGIGLG